MKVKRFYSLIPNKLNEWQVLEEPTNQIIKKFDSVVSAQELCDKLNSGGAFNGNTPPFFLIPLKIREESNT